MKRKSKPTFCPKKIKKALKFLDRLICNHDWRHYLSDGGVYMRKCRKCKLDEWDQ